jgi:hypothetical protein
MHLVPDVLHICMYVCMYVCIISSWHTFYLHSVNEETKTQGKDLAQGHAIKSTEPGIECRLAWPWNAGFLHATETFAQLPLLREAFPDWFNHEVSLALRMSCPYLTSYIIWSELFPCLFVYCLFLSLEAIKANILVPIRVSRKLMTMQ